MGNIENTLTEKTTEPATEKTNFKFRFRTLLLIWVCTFAVLGTFYFISFLPFEFIKAETFWVLSNILSFASFMVTSFFSYSLVRQSDTINKQDRENNDIINARSESFRTLQFVASNYAAVDFVDYMLMYEVYGRYINELKATQNLKFYMREEGISVEEIFESFDDFVFVSIRIPIQPLSSNNSVTAINFSDFHFYKEDTHHHFVPCTASARNALILFNKDDKRQEVVINLAVRKTSEFWMQDAVNPFLKITFNSTMYSMLGVAVTGWTELYFVNPHKLEKGGANKYIINSSQFEISGLPKLSTQVESDIRGQTSKG